MKIFLKYYLFIILGGIISTAKSQFITLEDTCVLNKLIANHSSLLNSEKQFDTIKAKSLYSELNLSNSCISDLTILKYFPNISSLKLDNNKLTDITLIQNKQVSFLFLNNNNISDVSPIYLLPKLHHIEIYNNKINILNTPQIPSSISWFNCGNNPIEKINSLDSLTTLKALIISENQLAELPSVQNLKNLEELHINNTNLQAIDGLDSLKKLKKLFAHFTKLKSIKGLDSNTTLELLSFDFSEISDLPYLSNKKSLIHFTSLTNNNLSFADFIKEKEIIYANNVVLSPQKLFFLSKNDTLNEKDSISFIISVEQQATENSYSWYRNDTLIHQTSLPYFTLSSLKDSDGGEYHVEITNSNFPNTILSSQNWKLLINPCMQGNNPELTILTTDCKTGYSIKFTKEEITTNNEPFHYVVKNVFNNNSQLSDQILFKNLIPGSYTFNIIDSKNCQLSYPFILNPLDDCKNVLSPNNDGLQDDFFILEEGITVILDKNSEEILKFQTPNSWNGKNKNGEFVQPGYYIIITNEKNVSGINVVY